MNASAVQAALRSPLYDAIAPWVQTLPRERFPTLEELNAWVEPGTRTGGGAPLRFVAARTDQGQEQPYEVGIFRTGEVPTRDSNWHDLFNALAWLAYPATKAAINRRHYESIEAARQAGGGRAGVRGTVRDALTLFDEGGIVVGSSRADLLELLRAFRWSELFYDRRAEVGEHMRFFVFGHAIFEKALEPYKSVTAKALLLHTSPELLAANSATQRASLDRQAAAWFLHPDTLTATRDLSPLPVLGIPGWADNDSPAFYADTQVFRTGYGRRR